ncbi:MAG TPA: hypothetical protein VFY73_11660 [Ideonella sp.]|uniref:hypothetical protein n=1 Tax=Ideonella sp. TaxID=1929293 RepID=UPI002E33DE64|nr:hypothetical protein [Ideonella sp.]HEX5684677.1 hypothetical protein [Ideonella sp.]
MLKKNDWAVCAALLAGTVTLSACGGGGNESGEPGAPYASPPAVGVKGGEGTCYAGPGPTVFIYGGQPPYKLDNSLPQGMQVDKQVVTDSGQGFTITFNGQCMEAIPVTIEDDMGRVLAVPVTNEEGA